MAIDVRTEKQILALVKPLGRPGGQASVYEHPTDPRCAVKVYHPGSLTHEQIEKNEYLIDKPISVRAGDHCIVQLREIVYDTRTNQVIGVVLDRVADSVDLATIALCEHVSLEFRLKIALNLARCVADIHAAGHARGDLHPQNELVNQYGDNTSIDIDSLQVNAGGRSFRCGYGVWQLQAPEFQGVDYADVDFTELQDRWSAAALLFMVCVDGYHAQDGIYKGAGHRPDLQTRIREPGYFPFGPNRRPDFVPKTKMEKAYGRLPRTIKVMFERAFDLGHSDRVEVRPDMEEWAHELARHAPRSVSLSDALWHSLQHPGVPIPTPVPARRRGVDRLPGPKTGVAVAAAAACLMVGAAWQEGLLELTPSPQAAGNVAARWDAQASTTGSISSTHPSHSKVPDIKLHQLPPSRPGKVPALWTALCDQGERQ